MRQDSKTKDRNPIAFTPEQRMTAEQVRDEQTGKFYLRGRESIENNTANVFGNADFEPVSWRDTSDKAIVFEAEVVASFTATADDDAFDRADVYRFRLWGWSNRAEGAVSRVSLNWQDFNGDDVPGFEYGWDDLLIEAVERLRQARSGSAPAPAWVGAPA